MNVRIPAYPWLLNCYARPLLTCFAFQGLQTIDNWQNYFNHPHGSVLGVFNAIQSIGGIIGLPLAPYLNDRFGRRWCVARALSFVAHTDTQLQGAHYRQHRYDHRRRASDRSAERRHVHWLSFPHRRRPLVGDYGRAGSHYRARVPDTPRTHDRPLQLVLVPRFDRRRLGHLRHLPHRQHVVVAHPFRPAGHPVGSSTRPRLPGRA
jgi:hypothetical protein